MAAGDNCNQCLEHTGQKAEIAAIKEIVNGLSTIIHSLSTDVRKMWEELIEQGGSVERLDDKVEKMELLTEAVNRMSYSIETIVGQNGEMVKSISTIDTRLGVVEALPGKTALKMVKWVVVWVATAIGMYFLGRMGL